MFPSDILGNDKYIKISFALLYIQKVRIGIGCVVRSRLRVAGWLRDKSYRRRSTSSGEYGTRTWTNQRERGLRRSRVTDLSPYTRYIYNQDLSLWSRRRFVETAEVNFENVNRSSLTNVTLSYYRSFHTNVAYRC